MNAYTKTARADGMPYVESRSGRIFIETQGSGEPILLIPGLGMDHTYYRFTTPILAKHFETNAADPLGIGQSDKKSPYSVESWAADFGDVIENIGHGPMHVVGSSLGGATAIALAESRPELVRSLTVVGGFSELDRAAALNFGLRARLIRKLGMSDEVADYMGLWTLTREFINSDEGFAQMKANQENIRRNSAEQYLAFVEALLAWGRCLEGQATEPKFTTRLPNIKAPTLVLTSENDHLIPLELSKIVADNIPGAKFEVMRGFGHILFVEHPRETTDIVMKFIQSIPK
jgi:pimeloyl-ACP methyl ester carboxylesterase